MLALGLAGDLELLDPTAMTPVVIEGALRAFVKEEVVSEPYAMVLRLGRPLSDDDSRIDLMYPFESLDMRLGLGVESPLREPLRRFGIGPPSDMAISFVMCARA